MNIRSFILAAILALTSVSASSQTPTSSSRAALISQTNSTLTSGIPGNITGYSNRALMLNFAASMHTNIDLNQFGVMPILPCTGVVNGNGSSPATCLSTPLSIGVGGTGAVSFTAGLPLFGNGTAALTQGTLSGNTTELATVTGSLTSGACLVADSNKNIISASGACGTGTVVSGLTGNMGYWATGGTTISPYVLGTGILTALGVNVGTAGSLIVNGGALGTPSSGTGTNITGVPAGSLSGATLAAGVTASSLTSVGTLTSLAVQGVFNAPIGGTFNAEAYGSGPWSSSSGFDAGQAINAALTACIANGAGNIILPAGSYYQSTQVNSNQSNCSFISQAQLGSGFNGQSATLLTWNGTGPSAFQGYISSGNVLTVTTPPGTALAIGQVLGVDPIPVASLSVSGSTCTATLTSGNLALLTTGTIVKIVGASISGFNQPLGATITITSSTQFTYACTTSGTPTGTLLAIPPGPLPGTTIIGGSGTSWTVSQTYNFGSSGSPANMTAGVAMWVLGSPVSATNNASGINVRGITLSCNSTAQAGWVINSLEFSWQQLPYANCESVGVLNNTVAASAQGSQRNIQFITGGNPLTEGNGVVFTSGTPGVNSGNFSYNQWIDVNVKGNNNGGSTAVVLGNADSNTFSEITCQQATGWGFEIQGSSDSTDQAAHVNLINRLACGNWYVEGGTAGWTQYASRGNVIAILDTANGTPAPTVDTGTRPATVTILNRSGPLSNQGLYAVDLQGCVTTDTATGEYAVVLGCNNQAGLAGAVGGGIFNVAGQGAAVSGGQNNSAAGAFSSITGGNENSANYAYSWIPGGWGTKVHGLGMGCWSSVFTLIAQSCVQVLTGSTASTSSIILTADNSGTAGGSDPCVLATGNCFNLIVGHTHTVSFTIVISGQDTTAPTTNYMGREMTVSGTLSKSATAGTTVYSGPATIATGSGDAGTGVSITVAVAADGAQDGLKITITNLSANAWIYSASVQPTAEVTM